MSPFLKRSALIILGIFLVLLLLSNIFTSTDERDVEVDAIVNSLGMSNTGVAQRDNVGVTELPTLQGGDTVKARDFLSDADVVDWDGAGTYVLGAGQIDQKNAYQLFYFEADKSINVVLLTEPFGNIRKVAESQLLERLGVSEKDACSMDIRVSVPGFASESLSGRDLGLSFCPGSLEL
ncbi:MAG: hypothetical protein MUF19_02440 [Candidatus Pacebacteria bacterium]|jgi:hypothetical protein|nr:hypothetical protein [Candidatus Paceibacterota bacterium]